MSNLSDRVMNMKFMRKTDGDKEDNNKEEQQKKIKDMSEWVLPNYTKLIAKSEASNVIQSIGYASINSFSMDEKEEEFNDAPMPANVGRRTWGEPESKKSSETELDIKKLKDAIPKKKVCIFQKSLSNDEVLTIQQGKNQKNDKKVEEQNNEPEQESELDTKDFLESLWKKNSTPTDKGYKKRKSDKKEEYVPDIKKKRKRFTNV